MKSTSTPPHLSPMKRNNNYRSLDKQSKHEEAMKSANHEAPRSLFSCREQQQATTHGKCKRIGCSGSICKLRDMRKSDGDAVLSDEACNKRANTGERSTKNIKKKPLKEITPAMSNSVSLNSSTSSSLSLASSFKGMPLRRFSGCYECHSVINPRDVSFRTDICSCPHCGEIFINSDSLELHQRVKHAVAELSHEDGSRNVVEIIFQSSWLNKLKPIYKIERILKVNNTKRTLARFEEYRDSIKMKASNIAKRHPRCIADGNELLRFHCTTLQCSLGLDGTTNLCNSIPKCNLCGIIRDSFKADEHGRIVTMATSGRAHEAIEVTSIDARFAMLVCRVIAGRVKRNQESVEDCDSVCGAKGNYNSLEELFVFDSKAILPCFVVIYRCSSL